MVSYRYVAPNINNNIVMMASTDHMNKSFQNIRPMWYTIVILFKCLQSRNLWPILTNIIGTIYKIFEINISYFQYNFNIVGIIL